MVSNKAVAQTAQLLRGQLRSWPGPTGMSAFTLPCRKLVLRYNGHYHSALGARLFATDGELVALARRYPSMEVVLQQVSGQTATAQALYVNGREKVINLQNRTVHDITQRVHNMIQASGRKVVPLKRRTVVAGAEESARGVWSALHTPNRRT